MTTCRPGLRPGRRVVRTGRGGAGRRDRRPQRPAGRPCPGATIAAMSTRAVVFDLDDTLIVEVSFAMTSFREALATLPGVDPDASEVVALEAVRSVWTTGADHELAVRLGFASWEGLWSTFAGNHPSLAGLDAWAPTYRAEAWRAVGTVFGIDDQAPPGRRGRHVRGGAAPRPPGDRRHARRPRRGGRPPSGRPDHQRALGHPAPQARAVRTGGGVRMGGDLGRARCRQARAVGIPRAARRRSGRTPRPRSWSGTAGSATCSADCTPACRPCGSPTGGTVPEHRPRVVVVDSVLELPEALDQLACSAGRPAGRSAQPAIWRSM